MKLFVRDFGKLFAVCEWYAKGYSPCIMKPMPPGEWCAPCREKAGELNVDPDPGDGVEIR